MSIKNFTLTIFALLILGACSVDQEELEELSEEVVEEELEVLTELSDTWFGDKGLESSSLEQEKTRGINSNSRISFFILVFYISHSIYFFTHLYIYFYW